MEANHWTLKMEANRDAAEQYFDLAMDKLHSKEYEKALQYFLKSQELYPSQTTETKIKKLKNFLSSPNNNQKETKMDEKKKEKQEKKLQQEEEAKFPKEQIDEIKSKIKCKGKKEKLKKDFYEILGISKDATEEEITKSYRKLCMKFHPDVNKAPGATEAFKNIGSAYSCLKDQQKRSNYDRFGSEDGPQRLATSRPFYSQRGFYNQQGDEDIDEIFRAFFGGGGASMFQSRGNPFFSRRQRRQRREEQEEEQEQERQTGSIFSFILQMLPIFLIFILPSIVSFIGSEGNKGSFSLDRTNSYSVRRTTKVNI
jgi:hypothetical protein